MFPPAMFLLVSTRLSWTAFAFLKVKNGQFEDTEVVSLCEYGVTYSHKLLGKSVFCNISVWGVINYSMTVLSMGKYLKCDSLCKYLSSTKLLYFFICRYLSDDDKILVILKLTVSSSV